MFLPPVVLITHDYWAVKKQFDKKFRFITINIPPTLPATQKIINSKIHELNDMIRKENFSCIPGYTTHAYTVDLARDTLKMVTKKPKSKVQRLCPNSTVHSARHKSYKMFEKLA